MHTRSEVKSSVRFERHPARILNNLKQREVDRIAVAGPRALLVGRDTSWGIALLRLLDRFGIGFSFAPPLRVTPEFVRNGSYTLVLVDSTVPHQQRSQIAYSMDGIDASVYYAYPVEHDCWWVPIIRFGEYCYGDPAFRTNEFPAELKRLLRAPENP